MTKQQWIELFKGIGLSDDAMKKWHTLFETRYPEDHQRFLTWLGISDKDIEAIRMNSR